MIIYISTIFQDLFQFFLLTRLLVSPELKNKLKSKPYDPKKSCWVPNKATHGYDEGLIESTEGDKVTVMILETKEVNIRYLKISTKNVIGFRIGKSMFENQNNLRLQC